MKKRGCVGNAHKNNSTRSRTPRSTVVSRRTQLNVTPTELTIRIAGFQMTEKLIECVKKHPYLYDCKDPQYKDIGMKGKVWERIGNEINETGEVAKTKWKSLRDNYGRYKKEMSDPSIQVKKFVRWPWASHLQFLDGTIGERDRSLKGDAPMQFLEISLEEDGTRDSNYSDTQETPPPEEQEYEPRRKRIKRDSEAERSPELDAVGHLFKSYAQTFKTFTKKNQIALKVELAQLFADIEAKEMIEERK